MTNLELFNEVRKRFHVVGVVGMASSGATRFLSSVWKEPLFVITTTLEDDHGQHLKAAIAQGNEDIKNRIEALGINLILDGEHVKLTEEENALLSAACATDPTILKYTYNAIFNEVIAQIAKRLESVIEANDALSSKMGVPLFIEMPLSTEVNYRDYVDEIVAVVRPQEYSTDTWWVQNKANDCNTCASEISLETAAAVLKAADLVWNESKIEESADVILSNTTSEPEFVAQIFSYIDSKTSQIMSEFKLG